MRLRYRLLGTILTLSCLAAPSAFADGEADVESAAARIVTGPAAERVRVVSPLELPPLVETDSTEPKGAVPNVFPDAVGLGESPATGRLRVDESGPAGGSPAPSAPAIDATFPDIDVRYDVLTDGWTPPDPVMAAGDDHVVVLINTRIAVYEKTSGALAAGPWTLSNFFGIPPEFFDFDPLAVYDPHSGRFIVTALADSDALGDSRIYIAFSQTGDATGEWNVYTIDADRDQPDNWADYASIGVDSKAVYVTANMFSRSNSFRNVTLFVYDKEDGYAGTPIDNTHLIDVRTAGGGSPFRLRPGWIGVTTPNDAFYLAQTSTSFISEINFFRLTGDRFDAPTLEAFTVGLGDFYFGPGDARQPSSSGVSTLGGSLWNVHYRNGKVWTAHAVSAGSDISALVHRIDVTGATPTLEESVEIVEAGKDVYFPYVIPDFEDDDFLMLSAYSSPSDTVTARYWNVGAGGVVRKTELLRNGVLDNDSGRHGDYFAVGEDPGDPNRLWMIAQYMRRNSGFSGDQVVASVRFEDVPPPVSPPPTPGVAGVSGTPLTVEKAGGGDLTVSWDASTCPAGDYHLVWYDLASMSSYTVAEETCDVGNGGSWTGTPPGGAVGVIAVGNDDPSGTEGSHGVDVSGAERPSSAPTCADVKRTDGECL